MIGTEYTLSANVKLVDIKTGESVQCSGSNERCPEMGLYTEDSRFQNSGSYHDINAGTNGFHLLTGKFSITNELPVVQKTGIRLYVQSFKSQLIVDNVSMKVSPKSPTSAPISSPSNACKNMVSNSDIELGYSGYWTTYSSTDNLSLEKPGYQSATALKYSKTTSAAGPKLITTDSNKFKLSCTTNNTKKWIVSAQIRLLRKDMQGVGGICELKRTCPALHVLIKNTNGKVILQNIVRSYVDVVWNANAYNTFHTTVTLPTIPNWFTAIGEISIRFGLYSSRFDLLLDNFSIQPI
jgi:hypothetical protein